MSQIIEVLEVTHFHDDKRRTERLHEPSWEAVERELRSMHNSDKPLIDLMQDEDEPGASMMMICGGNNVFHIQVADDKLRWCQAYDPDGPDDVIEVWLSDQGFEAPRNWTWPIDDALELALYYFTHGKPHPGYNWD